MLTRHFRTLTQSEKRALAARLPLLAFRTRREVRRGEVEVLTFDVKRVWPLISCRGQGCCPYTWLIDTGDEFVHFRSWDLLPFVGEQFPGTHVVIERLPVNSRVVRATASGELVSVLPQIEQPEWEVFSTPPGDCDVLDRASVRATGLPQP